MARVSLENDDSIEKRGLIRRKNKIILMIVYFILISVYYNT